VISAEISAKSFQNLYKMLSKNLKKTKTGENWPETGQYRSGPVETILTGFRRISTKIQNPSAVHGGLDLQQWGFVG